VKRGFTLLTLLAVLVVAAIGGWLSYRLLDSWYLTPRSILAKAVRDRTAEVIKYEKAVRDRSRLDGTVDAYVDRTLGGNLETVDHRLRSRLNRLAERTQLQGLTVGTSSSGKVKESPAKSVFRNNASQRALRDQPDFVELEGWIAGSGSFEQVLRLVDDIENEPWMKRIDQFKIDPRDNGEKFDVTVRLTTLFLPGRAPKLEPTIVESEGGPERYAALVQTNPFRVPPPPPPPPVPQPQPMTDPVPPRAPAFPYEQWLLTGVAQSPAGAEIWLQNQQSKELRRLVVGEALQEAFLVSTNAEAAEFRLGEERFVVSVGKNLGDRSPVGQ